LSEGAEEIDQSDGKHMSKRVRLCAVSEITPERPSRFEVEGEGPLAVYNVDGNYYVTSDLCTHSTASLSEDGELDGFVIECTWHGGRFDIRTGAFLSMPCTVPLKTYPVAIEGDELYVTVES
jgi:nitrite reductase/ring-hydroxylating ferredoxin subunit